MGLDWPALGGIWPSYMVQWLTFVSARAAHANVFADQGYWRARYDRIYLDHLPFSLLDSVAGSPSPAFQTWLGHPDFDDYWAALAPSPKQLAEMTIPIFTRTGMFDNAQVGALEHYRNHLRYAPPEARAKHFLMIGPWDHGGTRTPAKQVGGINLGPASLLDMGDLEADWYDWRMRGGPQPKLLPKRVAYYVTGADVWKYADSLEEIGRSPTELWLEPDASSTEDRAERIGRLSRTAPPKASEDRFTADPLEPRSNARGADPVTDRSVLETLRGRAVAYRSDPFDRPTEISGIPTLTLWLTVDVPDADLSAWLYERDPAGKLILLDDAQLRLRYRTSRRKPEPITPGRPIRVDLGPFRFMSREVPAGSSVVLVVGVPSSPYLETNYQAGGVVAKESGKDARTAHLQLHQSERMRSVLRLPIATR
jgi:putative CocE/NonD family hydrolase